MLAALILLTYEEVTHPYLSNARPKLSKLPDRQDYLARFGSIVTATSSNVLENKRIIEDIWAGPPRPSRQVCFICIWLLLIVYTRIRPRIVAGRIWNCHPHSPPVIQLQLRKKCSTYRVYYVFIRKGFRQNTLRISLSDGRKVPAWIFSYFKMQK